MDFQELGESIEDSEIGKAFFQLSVDPCCIFDFSMNFHDLNMAWKRVLGWMPEDLIGSSLFDLMAEEDQEDARLAFQRILDGDTLNFLENRIASSDGNYRWLRWTAKALPRHNRIFALAFDITDQKRQFQILGELQHQAKIGAWSFDIRTKQVVWTDGVYDIFGKKKSLRPMTYEEGVNNYDEESLKKLSEAVNEALAESKPYDVVLRGKKTDGSRPWLRAVGYPEVQNGQVVRLFGTLQDIDEQEKARLDRQNYQESLAALGQLSSRSQLSLEEQVDSAIELASGFLSANHASLGSFTSEKYTAFSQKAFGREKNFLSGLTEVHYQKLFHFINRNKLDGARLLSCSNFQGLDPRICYWFKQILFVPLNLPSADESLLVFFIEDDKDIGDSQLQFLNLLQDWIVGAFERHEQKRRLVESQEKTEQQKVLFESIFSADPNIVLVLDVNERISEVNPAFVEAFGYEAFEVIGRPTKWLYENDGDAIPLSATKKVLARNVLKSFRSKSGRQVYGEISVAPLYAAGEMRGYVQVIADVTERIELEKKLEQERAKSIHSSKLATLGEMAAGIAHEINNPLAIISGYTQKIRRRLNQMYPFEVDTLKDLERILVTIDRISKIVKGLRIFSRESKATEVDVVGLGLLLEESFNFCEERFKGNGVQLIKPQIPEEVQVLVRSTDVSQVILNLLSNAFHAVEEQSEGIIEVAYEAGTEFAKIKVVDNGPGIPKEIADKIMEPFFTTKDVGKGTGLGLSISLSLAEASGGRLYLDRNYERTCFVLELPLQLSSKKHLIE